MKKLLIMPSFQKLTMNFQWDSYWLNCKYLVERCNFIVLPKKKIKAKTIKLPRFLI